MKIVFLLILSILGHNAKAEHLSVYAASSLTDVLNLIAKEYTIKRKQEIRFNFNASSRLAMQILSGAKVDIFFSADKTWVEYLEEKKIIKKEKTSDILSNELVVIAPVSSKQTLNDLKGLNRIKFNKLCLSQESVPVGKFAYEALRYVDVLKQVKPKIVNGESARNVLEWVARDEADLGIAFVTDAKIEPRIKILYNIPTSFHSKVIYTASLVGKRYSNEALSFYQFVQSQEAKKIFEQAGFIILKNGN